MNEESHLKTVVSHFSSEEEVAHYKNRATEGLRRWEQEIVRRFMSSGKVLSVGCGGGRESFALEQLGYKPYGIDISEGQIASANQTKKRRSSSATFQAYSGADFPFPDGFFRSVTVWSQVLGNVPGKRKRLHMLKECHRVLEPNGIVSASVHDLEKTMKIVAEAGQHYIEPEDSESGDILLDESSGGACYWHYFTGPELRDLFEDAGFTVVEESTSDKMGQNWDNLNIIVCRKNRANGQVQRP